MVESGCDSPKAKLTQLDVTSGDKLSVMKIENVLKPEMITANYKDLPLLKELQVPPPSQSPHCVVNTMVGATEAAGTEATAAATTPTATAKNPTQGKKATPTSSTTGAAAAISALKATAKDPSHRWITTSTGSTNGMAAAVSTPNATAEKSKQGEDFVDQLASSGSTGAAFTPLRTDQDASCDIGAANPIAHVLAGSGGGSGGGHVLNAIDSVYSIELYSV